MKRGLPVLLLVLAAAGLALLWGGRAAPRPHVLVVTIDTLRADALTPGDTPALLDLAARGARWTHARAPAPLTLPSHATLLSGRAPPAHGLRDNTAPPLPARGVRGYLLLAEELKDAGYATAAFVASAVLGSRYGLAAGFDEYREPAATRHGVPAFATLDGAEQVERFAAWLATRPRKRPYFAWVHLWEPHAPYRPYAGDGKRAGTIAADPAAERYAGEVRYADALVERLLGLVDVATTVVVVTSDHGEALGAHGETTHGHLCHGETMDVPLVMAGPGVAAGAYDRPCSLADVAATLRRLCGIGGAGPDLFELPDARVVCGESLYANRLYGWAQQSAAYDGRFSLIDGGPRLELFDRAADPGETNPLPDPERHAAFLRLDRALQAYRAGPAGGAGTELALAGSPYGSLRRAVSGFVKPKENRGLRDVRAALPDAAFLGRVTAAVAARDRALLERLRPRLRRLLEEDPANPAPALALGRALLLVLDEPKPALAALEEAVRRGYPAPALEGLLGEARRRAAGR